MECDQIEPIGISAPQSHVASASLPVWNSTRTPPMLSPPSRPSMYSSSSRPPEASPGHTHIMSLLARLAAASLSFRLSVWRGCMRCSLIFSQRTFQSGTLWRGPFFWSRPSLWRWHSGVTSSRDSGCASNPSKPPTSARPSELRRRTARFRCSCLGKSWRMTSFVGSLASHLLVIWISTCPATVGTSPKASFLLCHFAVDKDTSKPSFD
mmetsp:Transcript_58744/g.167178  ORF Transcript_58744/g.167178 Transcript_58744/m.167178 type:complete len:209 (-) Transcript_58744:69-695(-)